MVKERIDSEGYEPISGGGNTPLSSVFRKNYDSKENENKKIKGYIYDDYKLPYKKTSDLVESPERASKPAIKPLPDPLPIAAGFYFDDEQLGWDLFQHEFGEPQSVVCRAAFPRKDKKDIYDIISIEIPITKDADGLYIFDDSRLLQEHTNLANAGRPAALLFTASFANSSVPNTKDYQQRDLPRLNERDSAFISLLKSIDKQIGDTPYALSDIVSFFRIEDIIKHPLLAQDIPQSLQANQDIEVDLDNGTTLTRIGWMPEPRKHDYLKHAAFKQQNLVRSVTIDEPKTLQAPPQVQSENVADDPNSPFRLKPPGWLARIFKREASKRIDLFNEFSRQLQFFGLRIIEHTPNGKDPLNGVLTFKNPEGMIQTLNIKFDETVDAIGTAEIFHVASNRTTYNLMAKDFSSDMQNSERKNLSSFAHDMAQKTSLVFQKDVENVPQLQNN